MSRLRQGYRTAAYPVEEPVLPERFRGRPQLDAAKCRGGDCQACVAVCPVNALAVHTEAKPVKSPLDAIEPVAATPASADARLPAGRCLKLDTGACLFCGACAAACPQGAISFSAREYRLAARQRQDLWITPDTTAVAAALSIEAKRLFRHSLKLRQVSAGGCNACESDVNVLNTLAFDLGRFGIQFVASPRHADGILVTGPVSANMREALLKTYDAVPAPKLVIAVGACAIAGGPYRDHPEVHNGIGSLLPVDLYVPGCPPHPYTILDGLLRLLGRI